MTEEHEAAALFLLSTICAAAIVLAVTVAIDGGISTILFEVYVAPLLVSSLALGIFWLVLYNRHRKSRKSLYPEAAAR